MKEYVFQIELSKSNNRYIPFSGDLINALQELAGFVRDIEVIAVHLWELHRQDASPFVRIATMKSSEVHSC